MVPYLTASLTERRSIYGSSAVLFQTGGASLKQTQQLHNGFAWEQPNHMILFYKGIITAAALHMPGSAGTFLVLFCPHNNAGRRVLLPYFSLEDFKVEIISHGSPIRKSKLGWGERRVPVFQVSSPLALSHCPKLDWT